MFTHIKPIGSEQPTDTLIVEIGEKKYLVQPWDPDLQEAIELALRWPEEQITYARIVHLEDWIRQNRKDGYNIQYEDIPDIEGCRLFVESVIDKLFSSGDDEDYKDSYDYSILMNNQLLFL